MLAQTSTAQSTDQQVITSTDQHSTAHHRSQASTVITSTDYQGTAQHSTGQQVSTSTDWRSDCVLLITGDPFRLPWCVQLHSASA